MTWCRGSPQQKWVSHHQSPRSAPPHRFYRRLPSSSWCKFCLMLSKYLAMSTIWLVALVRWTTQINSCKCCRVRALLRKTHETSTSDASDGRPRGIRRSKLHDTCNCSTRSVCDNGACNITSQILVTRRFAAGVHLKCYHVRLTDLSGPVHFASECHQCRRVPRVQTQMRHA